MPLIEDREYEEARKLVNLKMSKIVESFSPTFFKSGERGFAVSTLKDKFYRFLEEYFPEIKSLMNIEKVEKVKEESVKQKENSKISSSIRSHQIKKNKGLPPKSVRPKIHPEKSHLINSRTWEVPAPEEIKPGLVVRCKNVALGFEYDEFEFIDFPRMGDDGEYYAYVIFKKGNNRNKTRIKLADFGIVSYKNGWWNAINRPVKWYNRRGL